MQCRKDRDRGLKPRIDVGVRQTVGARLAQNLVIVSDAVGGEPSLGLDSRSIGHSALPWSALTITGDRGVDQARVPRRQRLVVQPKKPERSGPEVLDDHVRSVA